MLNYTKGQWITDALTNKENPSIWVHCGCGCHRSIAHTNKSSNFDNKNTANALLISKAPEMYEVLKVITFNHTQFYIHYGQEIRDRVNQILTVLEGSK